MGGEKAAGSRAGLYDPALYDTACVSSLTAMGRSNGRGPAASGVARTLTASERVRLTPHCSSISPPVSLRSNEAIVAEGLEHPGARTRAHEHPTATQSSDRPDLARAAARRCIKPVFWLRDIVSSIIRDGRVLTAIEMGKAYRPATMGKLVQARQRSHLGRHERRAGRRTARP